MLAELALDSIHEQVMGSPPLIREMIQEGFETRYIDRLNRVIEENLSEMIDVMSSLDDIPEDWYYKHIFPHIEAPAIDVLISTARHTRREIKNRSCVPINDEQQVYSSTDCFKEHTRAVPSDVMYVQGSSDGFRLFSLPKMV